MLIVVLCGIISNSKGEIFIARRKEGKSMAGKWEFPGGKLEAGESEQECLKRELQEELGMKVEVGMRLGENEHHYESISIKLIAYQCTFVSATYSLTDHDRYTWLNKEEIKKYDLAEADKPLLKLI